MASTNSSNHTLYWGQSARTGTAEDLHTPAAGVPLPTKYEELAHNNPDYTRPS